MAVTFRTLASVFKLRIGLFCALAAIAGALVNKGALPETAPVVAVAFAVLLSAAAAGAFNHYWERDLDPLMTRTLSNPTKLGRADAEGMGGFVRNVAATVLEIDWAGAPD